MEANLLSVSNVAEINKYRMRLACRFSTGFFVITFNSKICSQNSVGKNQNGLLSKSTNYYTLLFDSLRIIESSFTVEWSDVLI